MYRKKIASAYRAVLNDEPLIDIAHDLGYGSINGARETLKSEWWIGHKTRLRTTNERQWNEEKQRWFVGGKKLHSKPVRVAIPNLVADPAVSVEIWQAVQAKLAVHSDYHQRRQNLSKELLATGYLHCGACGSPMYHKGQKSRTEHAGYFWCKSKAMSYHKDARKKTADCGIGLILVKTIEDDIVIQIQMHLGNRKTCNQLLEDASNVEAVEEHKRSLARVERQIEDANKEKSRMLNAIRKGLASDDEYEDALLEVRNTINSLTMKALSIRQDIESSVSPETRSLMAAQMAGDFAGFHSMPFDRQAMLLRKYVKKIVARRNPLGDVSLHFEVKIGAPEMLHQPDSFSDSPARKPGQRVKKAGRPEPLRVMRGGTIGGAPSLDEVRSNIERRPTSSS